MDWTTLQHTVIALAFTGLGYLIGNPLAGACFGVALLIGREHAQAEYRWIETKGGGKRANMPWWGGFDPSVWSFSSILDWLAPTIACTVLMGCLFAWA